MQTLTGTYLAEQRKARNLSREQLARRIGYQNLAKGARRLQDLEHGKTVEGLLGKVVKALELDPEHIVRLFEQDRRENIHSTAGKHWVWNVDLEELRPKSAAVSEACKRRRVLLPAETCAICDRPISVTLGKRLVACYTVWVARIAVQSTLPSARLAYPARLVRLTGRYRDVVVWLGGRVWTDEGVQRAATAFQRGEHPWVCQRCAKIHLCARCGTPIDRTPMSDCIFEDGRILHSAHFMGYGKPFCPRCEVKTEWIRPLAEPEMSE